MAKIGHESGELDEQESMILTQMLSVKEMPVTAIMTPRTVMFSVPATMTQTEFAKLHKKSPFTRIPVFDGDRDNIVGYVNRNTILLSERDTPQAPISAVRRNLVIVPETAKILPLFQLMIKRNTKIAMVVDEYGSGHGIVTLEDIIESLLGLEIVDSNDPVTDMQQLARRLWKRRMTHKGIRISDEGSSEDDETPKSEPPEASVAETEPLGKVSK